MNKTKTFIQYSDTEFYIKFVINIDGSFKRRTEILNKYKMAKIHKKYYKNNLIKFRDYHKRNKNKINKYKKEYYIINKEIITKKRKEFRKNNPDKFRIHNHKQKEKRKSWGEPIPINLYFKGAHLHHIHIHDKRTCIYVPGDLHKSIGHKNTNSESMNRINNAIKDWILKSVYEAKIKKSL